MDYRDERTILKEQVESLTEQLARAQGELAGNRDDVRRAHVDRLEREVADARKVIDRLEVELRGMRETRPRSTKPLFLLAALGLTLIGVAVLVVVVAARSKPAPSPRVEPTSTIAQATVSPPKPAPTTPAPVVPTSAPRPRRVAATWNVTVKQGKGDAPKAGTRCVVAATIQTDSDGLDAQDVTFTCGGKAYYRDSDDMSGESMTSSAAEERPGDVGGTNVYAIGYSDQGARSGRAQIVMDSQKGVGAVFDDPYFRIDFVIPRWSTPVEASPLSSHAIGRAGTVHAVTGNSPVSIGAACKVWVWPRNAKTCGAELRCGAVTLFGAALHDDTKCVFDADGKIVSADDDGDSHEDGDPAIHVVPGDNLVVARDRLGGAAWTATVTLE